MTHFGAKPRFEVLEDQVVRVREGTQMNCGGIAQLTAYIFDEVEPRLIISFEHDGIMPLSRIQTPAAHIPAEFKAVIEASAAEAFAEASPTLGLEVCIVSAIVHPVDANERVFRACTRRLVVACLAGEHIQLIG